MADGDVQLRLKKGGSKGDPTKSAKSVRNVRERILSSGRSKKGRLGQIGEGDQCQASRLDKTGA